MQFSRNNTTIDIEEMTVLRSIRSAAIFAMVAVLSMPAAAWSDRAELPHNLSPWGMFLSADSVVKAMAPAA